MRPDYIIKRFVIFLVIVWVAATLNFFIPRLGSRSPIEDKLMTQAATGGYLQQGVAEMVKEYEAKFGLDKPLWQQYLNYWGDIFRLDLGVSLADFPQPVISKVRWERCQQARSVRWLAANGGRNRRSSAAERAVSIRDVTLPPRSCS